MLDVPIRSIALGRAPYVAILSAQPWMHDGTGWRELALPSAMTLAEGDDAAIFFGRDDKPRIMGAQRRDAAWGPVYYRWRHDGWERDRREIGRLASAPLLGLYGVLGDADPEVVCKDGDVCIIKRRTGWKTIPAPKGRHRVWVMGGLAYMLLDDGMTRLDGDRWAPVPWFLDGHGKESGFWVDPQGGMWVSVAEQNAIYRSSAGRFERMPSPVRAPSALWGTSAGDVWVAGHDGLGHYDGVTWQRVAGLEGSFEHLCGRQGVSEIWIGGRSGLWKASK